VGGAVAPGRLQFEHDLPGARTEGDAVSAGRGLQRPERARVVRVAVTAPLSACARLRKIIKTRGHFPMTMPPPS